MHGHEPTPTPSFRHARDASTVQLTFFDFVQRLAIDTLGRGGTRFQAPQTDLDAAGVAVAIVFLVEPLDGLVDLLDQFAFPIASSEFDAELLFLRGTIGWIGEVGGLVLHVVDGWYGLHPAP